MTTSSAIDAGACVSRHGRRRLRRCDVADIPPLAYLGPIKGFLISAFDLAMLAVNARAALMDYRHSLSVFDEMELHSAKSISCAVELKRRLSSRTIRVTASSAGAKPSQ
ncbi:hypothetical protein [Mesorhizobium helmanticense]|uniref:hypothetical protein n=1 Tax=Mesorhizobium helmanticense TaxID=1776423 RepID=UPI0011B21735|nr:hypothetical protein [Mesorhizobium helmanticense]